MTAANYDVMHSTDDGPESGHTANAPEALRALGNVSDRNDAGRFLPSQLHATCVLEV